MDEKCDRCGEQLKVKTVIDSEWLSDGPGPCAGTGRAP